MKIKLLQDIRQGMAGDYKLIPQKYYRGDILEVIPASNLPENSEIKFWVNQDGWDDDGEGFPIYDGSFTEVLYEVQYMKKWIYPSYYGGETYEEFYIFMSITRDADILEESNWNSFLQDYPEGFDWDTNKGILIQRSSHFACGWVDTIYIHESDYENLEICDKIRERLSDYPIYDENDFSEMESEAQYSSVKDQIEYFIRHDFDLEELSDNQIEQMIYWYCRECNSNDSIPKEEEFYELYDRAIHFKECKICKEAGRNYEYDDRSVCECQMNLF